MTHLDNAESILNQAIHDLKKEAGLAVEAEEFSEAGTLMEVIDEVKMTIGTVKGTTPKSIIIQRLYEPTKKIQAIKALRSSYDLGLKEAKDIIDKVAAGEPQRMVVPMRKDMNRELALQVLSDNYMLVE